MDANERNRLAKLIVEHVADYRKDEITPVNENGVIQWLQQFDTGDQPNILREIERILDQTYISRQAAKTFISGLSGSKELTGKDPKDFWRTVGFLRLQKTSESQTDMLALLNEVLGENFGLSADKQESTDNTYVYLDDVSFSGNQVKNDLTQWVGEKNITNATVHVIVIGAHTQGEYYASRELTKVFRPRGIKLHFWASLRIENSPPKIKDSEVMWPTKLPADEYLKKWEATFAKGENYFMPRPPGGNGSTGRFSSEASRETIEQAFLKKGAYIYSLSKNPQRSMRPLGFSPLRTPGFGATIVTYRNCPNNAPLVLWWGDPTGGPPLNQWMPLLPRRVRGRNPGSDFDVVDI